MKDVLQRMGYRDACLIGQGGFAKIYRVKETDTGRFLACKISRDKKMLRSEGQILQQLRHVLFPDYVSFEESGAFGCLFMEYIPGRSLKELVKRRGKLSQRQVIRIGMALAQGLCYLHQLSIPVFYRDLKPENIMIREDGEIKLLDFGSAVRADALKGAITGTLGYSAPEQWSDAGCVGEYSDVYALGKVMKFMLGDGRRYVGLECLLKAAVQETIEERIPDMICFMSILRPYTSADFRVILRAEAQACFNKGWVNYLFLQNIVKI